MGDIAISILEKLWKLRVENKVELYYTDLNILEISWKISRLEFNNTIVEKADYDELLFSPRIL